MKRITLLTLASVMATLVCHAQDFKTVVGNMRNEFANAELLQIVMRVSVFDSKEATEPYSDQLIDIRKNANEYCYAFDEKELLLTEKSMVMVDRAARQINYRKRDVKAEKVFHENVKFNIDSILSAHNEVTFIGSENDIQHYRIDEKKGPISKIHFYISAAENTLKKIQYEYYEGPFVSIDFVVFDKGPVFDSLTFSEQRIVQKVDNKMLPSKYYKNYRVNYQ
jgi:hypothetical protein